MRPNDRYSPFTEQDVIEGTKVEMEHTSDPKVARRIALDHLEGEDPRYYEKLRHIEHGSTWGWDALFKP